MKKSVVSALTAALVVGATATTFAAANPFSDVPAGHWAYNSVTKLAADGIIEGYGDGTFLGNRNITRYEMAQMIAKALAKNPSGADRAELDKLAAEFREELNNLGVRVSELEKHADMVQWTGKIEYTYGNRRVDPFNGGQKHKTTSNGYVFRFEPKAEVNEHWTVNARLDATGDLKDDSTNNVDLIRVWAQADYDKFQFKVGRMEFYTNESGLIWDTEYSGAQVTFGSKLKATVMAGRLSDGKVVGGERGIQGYYKKDGLSYAGTDPSTFIGANLQYDPGEKGLVGGLGYYYVKDEDVTWGADGSEHKANIWSVNLGYKFSDMLKLTGSYAKNSKADWEDDSWQAELRYGKYGDRSDKGDYAIWAGYRKFGTNLSYAGTTSDDALLGTKGFIAGAAYAPFKNVGLIVKYFNGEYITGGGDAEKLFGRVEVFF